MELPKTWFEILDSLAIGACEPVTNTRSVYSAIWDNFRFSEKRFTIRTDPVTGFKYVWRLPDAEPAIRFKDNT